MSTFFKLAACALAMYGSLSFAAEPEQEIPVIEFRVPLPTVGFLMSYSTDGITSPQLQVFDARHLSLANIARVPVERFIPLVEEALDRDEASLEMRLAAGGWETPDGKPVDVSTLPKADYYFVEYWAEWCKPCHQLQASLFEYLAELDSNAVVIRVEMDPMQLYRN